MPRRRLAICPFVLLTLALASCGKVPDENRRGAAACAPQADCAGPNELAPLFARPLVVYNLAEAAQGDPASYYDAQVFVAALQGLLNRSTPRLYVLVPKDPRHENFWYDDGYSSYDEYWLRRLSEKSLVREVVRVKSLEVLLGWARQLTTEVKGLAVWHEATPATLNAAFTAAGVESLIPVRYSEAPDSLYQRALRAKVPVRRDFRSLTTKGQVYRWLIDTYLKPGRVDSTVFGYTLDGYFLKDPERQARNAPTRFGQPESFHVYNNQILSRDDLVARRALMFDLLPVEDGAPNDDPSQPPGQDLALLREILSYGQARLPKGRIGTVVGFPNWAFKYARPYGAREAWDLEWSFAREISRFYFAKDADAIHPAGMSNASVFRHFPLRRKAPNRPPLARPPYDPQKVYVHLHLGDYDSAAWIWFHGRHLWDDPARGRIPLSWGFNPNLAERVPPLFAHFFDTATPNDYFVGADTGAGYLNPGFLDDAGLERWVEQCTTYYERLGYEHTGWALNGWAGSLSAKVRDAFARCSPGGVVAHDGFDDGRTLTQARGVPFVAELRDSGSGQAMAYGLRDETSAEVLAERLLAQRPSHGLIALRTVLVEPTRLVALAKALAARGAEVVDPYTFFDAARRRLRAAPP